MQGAALEKKPDRERHLLVAAEEAARHAYAPYSGFAVGAAVLADNGKIYTGVNIENASYGLTVCAERHAIAAAVTDGQRRIEAIAVWAQTTPGHHVRPCGACRQVMAEFMAPDARIILAGTEAMTLDRLLPQAFDLQPDPCTDNS